MTHERYPKKQKIIHSLLDCVLPTHEKEDYNELETIANQAFVASLYTHVDFDRTCDLIFGNLTPLMSDDSIIARIRAPLLFEFQMNYSLIRFLQNYIHNQSKIHEKTSFEVNAMERCFSSEVCQQMQFLRNLKLNNSSLETIEFAVMKLKKLGGDEAVFYGPHIAHVLFGWSLKYAKNVGCYKLSQISDILQEYYIAKYFEIQLLTIGGGGKLKHLFEMLQQSKTQQEEVHWKTKINFVLKSFIEHSPSIAMIYASNERQIASCENQRSFL